MPRPFDRPSLALHARQCHRQIDGTAFFHGPRHIEYFVAAVQPYAGTVIWPNSTRQGETSRFNERNQPSPTPLERRQRISFHWIVEAAGSKSTARRVLLRGEVRGHNALHGIHSPIALKVARVEFTVHRSE